MLLKMGWAGEGSGLRDDGIASPVQPAAPAGKKRGLGADGTEINADTNAVASGGCAQAAGATTAPADAARAGKQEAEEVGEGGAKRKRGADEATAAASGSRRVWVAGVTFGDPQPAEFEEVRAALEAAPGVKQVTFARLDQGRGRDT